MAENKSQQLAEHIAAAVAAKLTKTLDDLGREVAALVVDQHTILARFEIFESMLQEATDGKSPGTAAPKRAVRNGAAPAAKAGGAAPKGGKGGKGAAKGGAPNLTNALLYFRHALANDWDGLRDTYCTEENLAEAGADSAVSKKDSAADPAGYYSAVGQYLWSKVLTKEQQDGVRALHKTWKTQADRGQSMPPLEEVEPDGGADGGADDAPEAGEEA